MKTLRIEIPGKPVLHVPIYDLGSVLMWLVQLFDAADTIEFTVKTVEL